MSSLWLHSSRNKKDLEDIYGSFYNEPVMRILKEVLEKLIKDSEMTPDYNNQSWSHLQAHNNGRRDAYRQVLSMLPVDKG